MEDILPSSIDEMNVEDPESGLELRIGYRVFPTAGGIQTTIYGIRNEEGEFEPIKTERMQKAVMEDLYNQGLRRGQKINFL